VDQERTVKGRSTMREAFGSIGKQEREVDEMSISEHKEESEKTR
jgi:hypothetical protein